MAAPRPVSSRPPGPFAPSDPSPGRAVFVAVLALLPCIVRAQRPTAPAPAPAAAATPVADRVAALREAARAHLEQQRAERALRGISAAFVLRDGSSGAVAVGSEDAAGTVPLREDRLLLSGSIGKCYVAAVALQLVGEGELALDGKVADVLGSTDWFARVPNAATVTLRHLLTHRSGIPDHVWKQDFQRRVLDRPDDAPAPVDCVRYVLGDEPLCAPGTEWHYADTNFVLVGLLIEAVTGRPYYTELRRRVLEPLHLDATLPSDRRDLPGLANAEATGVAFWRGETVTDGRYFVNPAFEYCGGGVASTALDLARFGHALFAGDLVPAALRGDFVDGVPAAPRVTERYGLGCFVMQTPHGPALGHSGFMPGHLGMLAHYREHGLTVALLWNTDSRKAGSPRRGADAFAAVLLDAAK